MTRLTLGGHTLHRAGVDEAIRNHRREGFGVGHAAGQELQYAAGADELLQSRTLVEPQHAGGEPEPPGSAEQVAQDEVGDADALGHVSGGGQLAARGFDERSVLDAGRAGGLATPAVEAQVDVLGERFLGERQTAFVHRFD